MDKKTPKHGFTFIELLIIVVVFGLIGTAGYYVLVKAASTDSELHSKTTKELDLSEFTKD